MALHAERARGRRFAQTDVSAPPTGVERNTPSLREVGCSKIEGGKPFSHSLTLGIPAVDAIAIPNCRTARQSSSSFSNVMMRMSALG
ncbi:MAG: hypothetical protein ACJ77E_18240, partial [Gaiellaceae bacterium]